MTKIIALIGEAGTGKDTLLQDVVAQLKLHEIISNTTRPKRSNEQDGVNYNYKTEDEFISDLNNNKMLEYSYFNGWYYGTSLDAISTDKVNIGVFNPQGIRSLLKNKNIELLTIRIKSLDSERLIRQLKRENKPNVDEIIRRYQTDKEDFSHLDFDYIEIPNNVYFLCLRDLLGKVEQFIKA